MTAAQPSFHVCPSYHARRAVLITRPPPGAAATAECVAAMGFEPILAPVLVIERVPVALPDPAAMAAILVTSSNAVDALPVEWRGCPLLAVGDATAKRAGAAGFFAVSSAAGDATALASLATQRLRPEDGPLLLASGEGQGMSLEADLRARGFAVVRREVYAARPVAGLPAAARAALDSRTLRACLFFSAETARVFVHLATEECRATQFAEVEALAIGQAAAVALERLPWRRIGVAARPTQDEMLALLR